MKIVRAAKDNINRVVQVFKLVRSSGSSGTGLPVGGTVGQFLQKSGTANFIAQWFTLTKDFIGLGNVTDDAQLKRSAGDFQAFTQKITPADGDSVIIEDGADGQNKKRALIDDFLGGGGGGGAETTIVQRDITGWGDSKIIESIAALDPTSQYDYLRFIPDNLATGVSGEELKLAFSSDNASTFAAKMYGGQLILIGSSSGDSVINGKTNQRISERIDTQKGSNIYMFRHYATKPTFEYNMLCQTADANGQGKQLGGGMIDATVTDIKIFTTFSSNFTTGLLTIKGGKYA